MKSFREYVEEYEEIKIKKETLNEDILTSAATILGYGSAGLVLGWIGALLVKGYSSLGFTFLNGIKNGFRKMFKINSASNADAKKMIDELKKDKVVKTELEKEKHDYNEYIEKYSDIFKAIEEKDPDLVIEEMKKANISLNDKKFVKTLIDHIVMVFEEPPIHYGVTGNETYLFMKKVLGIKIAQTVAALVRESMKKNARELINSKGKDDENKESEEVSKDMEDDIEKENDDNM